MYLPPKAPNQRDHDPAMNYPTHRHSLRSLFPLVVVALLLLSCSSISNLATPAAASFAWQTYSDATNGFSIDYPSTWFYYRSGPGDAGGSDGDFVLFSTTLGNTDIQSRSEDEEARLVVSSVANDSSQDLETWLADSPLLQANPVRLTINGVNALRVSVPAGNEADGSARTFLFLATPTRLYSLVGVVSPSANATLWQETITKMQESFKATR